MPDDILKTKLILEVEGAGKAKSLEDAIDSMFGKIRKVNATPLKLNTSSQTAGLAALDAELKRADMSAVKLSRSMNLIGGATDKLKVKFASMGTELDKYFETATRKTQKFYKELMTTNQLIQANMKAQAGPQSSADLRQAINARNANYYASANDNAKIASEARIAAAKLRLQQRQIVMNTSRLIENEFDRQEQVAQAAYNARVKNNRYFGFPDNFRGSGGSGPGGPPPPPPSGPFSPVYDYYGNARRNAAIKSFEDFTISNTRARLDQQRRQGLKTFGDFKGESASVNRELNKAFTDLQESANRGEDVSGKIRNIQNLQRYLDSVNKQLTGFSKAIADSKFNADLGLQGGKRVASLTGLKDFQKSLLGLGVESFTRTGRLKDEALLAQAIKFGVSPDAARSIKQPGFFNLKRLATPDSLVQLGFAGLLGGPTNLLGAAVGGASPLGPTGALAGSLIAATLISKPLEIIQEQGEKAKEAGLAFNRSILGISAIRQSQFDTFNASGQQIGPKAAAEFQSTQARQIQLAARSRLLKLGIGGQTEATFVQGIVAALSQRGIVATPEQIATISERIGGAIQTQRPGLLENTSLLLRDIEDVVSGGPQAKRTILSQLIGSQAVRGFQTATSADDIIKATASLASLAQTATTLNNPIVAFQKNAGALDNALTAAGDKLVTAMVPGLNALTAVLAKPETLAAAEKLGDALGTFTSASLKFVAKSLDLGQAFTNNITGPVLKALPALTQFGLVMAGVVAIARNATTQAAVANVFGQAQGDIFGGPAPIYGPKRPVTLAGRAPFIGPVKPGFFNGLGRAGLALGGIGRGVLGGLSRFALGPGGIALGLAELANAAYDISIDTGDEADARKTDDLVKSIRARGLSDTRKPEALLRSTLKTLGLEDEQAAYATRTEKSPRFQLESLRRLTNPDAFTLNKISELSGVVGELDISRQFNESSTLGALAANRQRRSNLPQALAGIDAEVARFKKERQTLLSPENLDKEKGLATVSVIKAKQDADLAFNERIKIQNKGIIGRDLDLAREKEKASKQAYEQAQARLDDLRTKGSKALDTLKVDTEIANLGDKRAEEAKKAYEFAIKETELIKRRGDLIAATIDTSTAAGRSAAAANTAKTLRGEIRSLAEGLNDPNIDDLSKRDLSLQLKGKRLELFLQGLKTASTERGDKIRERGLLAGLDTGTFAGRLATSKLDLEAALANVAGARAGAVTDTGKLILRSREQEAREAQRKVIQDTLGGVQGVLGEKRSRESLGDSALEVAKRFEELSRTITETNRTLSDFDRDTRLRSLSAKGSVLAAAQRFLKAGGSQVEVSSLAPEIAGLTQFDNQRGGFELDLAREELRSVADKNSSGRLAQNDAFTRQRLEQQLKDQERERDVLLPRRQRDDKFKRIFDLVNFAQQFQGNPEVVNPIKDELNKAQTDLNDFIKKSGLDTTGLSKIDFTKLLTGTKPGATGAGGLGPEGTIPGAVVPVFVVNFPTSLGGPGVSSGDPTKENPKGSKGKKAGVGDNPNDPGTGSKDSKIKAPGFDPEGYADETGKPNSKPKFPTTGELASGLASGNMELVYDEATQQYYYQPKDFFKNDPGLFPNFEKAKMERNFNRNPLRGPLGNTGASANSKFTVNGGVPSIYSKLKDDPNFPLKRFTDNKSGGFSEGLPDLVIGAAGQEVPSLLDTIADITSGKGAFNPVELAKKAAEKKALTGITGPTIPDQKTGTKATSEETLTKILGLLETLNTNMGTLATGGNVSTQTKVALEQAFS